MAGNRRSPLSLPPLSVQPRSTHKSHSPGAQHAVPEQHLDQRLSRSLVSFNSFANSAAEKFDFKPNALTSGSISGNLSNIDFSTKSRSPAT